jgi:N-acetylglucosamine-6-phosphate deacetylase
VAALSGRGELKPVARADVVVLSPNGEVRNTIIGGKV